MSDPKGPIEWLLGGGNAVVSAGLRLGGAMAGMARRSSLSSKTCLPATPKLTLPRHCGCEIPPPPGWPREAASVTSLVCEGGTATLRIEVTNGGPSRRQFRLRSSHDKVVLEPAHLVLESMASAVVVARLDVPAQGAVPEIQLWVTGCQRHFIRWRIEISELAGACCHEVFVEDTPDYEHHWYDHFYCEHPCVNP